MSASKPYNTDLLFRFTESPVYDQIDRQQSIAIRRLWGAGKGFFLAGAFRRFGQPLLVIAKGPKEVDTLASDIETFLGHSVLRFPLADPLIPGEVAPDPFNLHERLSCIHSWHAATRPQIMVIPCVEALRKILPALSFSERLMRITCGMSMPFDGLLERLVQHKFIRVGVVTGRGEFAVRGGIVDIFDYCRSEPIRIEFEDETIHSIREFDPITQESVGDLAQTTIMTDSSIYTTDTDAVCLLDHVSSDTIVVYDALTRQQEELEGLFGQIDARTHFFDATDLVSRSESRKQLQLLSLGEAGALGQEIEVACQSVNPLTEPISLQMKEKHFASILDLIQTLRSSGHEVHIFCENKGEEQRIRELAQQDGHSTKALQGVGLHVGAISAGFTLSDIKTVFMGDFELFGRYKIRRPKLAVKRAVPLPEELPLEEGAFVVHDDYGIGRYCGITRLDKDGVATDFLTIEYRNNAKLYVTLEQAHLVRPYVGIRGVAPPSDTLGTSNWLRRKIKAQRAVDETAAELLEVQVVREGMDGHAYGGDTHWQKEFEDAFIYEETEDQMKAITDVKQDMEHHRPMDRLICGDVGYGKTEVAVRGAFKSVMDGKQVAVLVPTTILAQQHFTTFTERMADYPVRVEVLSRFCTAAQQRDTIQALKEGKVDICIGTHRILQRDVQFKDLGLVIIDEEQRFGVRHKETFKRMRTLVDVLTLTATPIPRTLYMSLVGVKDMSSVNTPPQNRMPIKTRICAYDKQIVRNAILHELHREGQVYFVHNRVQTIDRVTRHLQDLVPEARIVTGHGQMPEKELKQVMDSFVRYEADVLCCTTIIESGMDIPNVNTIIIDRADRFGLAELYQLRGRVGRANERAFAYLLLPRDRVILEQAEKRLQAIQDASFLGAGFTIAMRDLEIRGAGSILGKQQHGHIVAVGFDLYCKLLREAVARLSGKPGPSTPECELDLQVKGCIPSSYIAEIEIRIQMYRKIVQLCSEQEVDALERHFRDRFGPVAFELQLLLEEVRLKILAGNKGVRKLKQQGDQVWVYDGGQAQGRLLEELPIDKGPLAVVEALKKEWVK